MNEAHIDLFSGIGGFSLAAGWAGFKTVVFCENDEFCQRVLAGRFGAVTNPKSTRGGGISGQNGKQETIGNRGHVGNIPIIPDIRDFDGTEWRGATLLTGGFPCQPFSIAGQRRGKDDDRHLWPEMLRVIKEARPSWVLAENVSGIVRMELDQVLTDLEGEDYTTGTTIIPACAKNAPHRRDRVWIIACNSTGGRFGTGGDYKQGRHIQEAQVGEATKDKQAGNGRELRASKGNSDAPNSESEGLEGGVQSTECAGSSCGEDWEENWIEVATRFCRVDDGVSNRVHRLKALGNAIVPQIAYEIIKQIGKTYMEETNE